MTPTRFASTAFLLLVAAHAAGHPSTAQADTAPTPPAPPVRWDAFPGPAVEPPIKTGVALVVAPIQAQEWTRVGIYFANVVGVQDTDLVIKGIDNQVRVPGAFVAPGGAAPALKVGSAVLF